MNHIAILRQVRGATQMNLAEWARYHGLNRVVVYNSAHGEGSRMVRVMIAQILGRKPSCLWPSRCKLVNLRDDKMYFADV